MVASIPAGGILQNQYQTGQVGSGTDTPVGGAGAVVGTGAPSAGAAGATGPVPGASDPVVTSAVYASILSSLREIAPDLSSEDATSLLLEAVSDIQKTVTESDSNKLKIDQEKKRSSLQQKQEQLDEAAKKIAEAAESTKNMSIWDKIKAAFQAFVAVLQIVVGIVACCFGAAVPGVTMILSGVTSAVMALDSIVKAATGHGIAGSIHLLLHPGDDDGAAKADLGMGVSLAGIALIIGIVGGCMDPSSAAAGIANATFAITSSVIAIGTAAGDVTTGVLKYQAADKQAEAQDQQAVGKRKEALIQALDDIIDQAITRLTANGQKFADILDSLTDLLKQHTDSVSAARFSA
jgi:hypothetical protein